VAELIGATSGEMSPPTLSSGLLAQVRLTTQHCPSRLPRGYGVLRYFFLTPPPTSDARGGSAGHVCPTTVLPEALRAGAVLESSRTSRLRQSPGRQRNATTSGCIFGVLLYFSRLSLPFENSVNFSLPYLRIISTSEPSHPLRVIEECHRLSKIVISIALD
jgi:hypothetical protein